MAPKSTTTDVFSVGVSNAECKALLDALRDLDAAMFGELDELHEELVESLTTVVSNDSEMFIGAS